MGRRINPAIILIIAIVLEKKQTDYLKINSSYVEKYSSKEPEVLSNGISNSLLKTRAFVNGEWINAASGKTFDVTNPATGELIASIPDMNRDDVSQAIDAAHDAW